MSMNIGFERNSFCTSMNYRRIGKKHMLEKSNFLGLFHGVLLLPIPELEIPKEEWSDLL